MPRNHRIWTDDELTVLRTRYEQGATYNEIAALFPYRTGDSVKTKIQAMQRDGMQRLVQTHRCQPVTLRPISTYQPPAGAPLVETFAPHESAEECDETFLARFVGESTRRVERARSQRYARLRIAADGPIALSLSSDWHIGTGADMQALIRYADWVGHTPNVYALAVGDLTDNPIKHRGGSVSGVRDELRMLDLLTGRFRGKLMGIASGNHDDWSKTLAGVDNLAALARRHRLHYAPDELLWDVELVDPTEPDTVTATYRIYTRHQWRRGSSLNPGHACWTWWQEEGPNWAHRPDVLAIGHNHQAVVEQRSFDDQPPVWALRMGAWQIDSDFARAKGFGRYRPTAPTVVLWPHRARDVQAFSDYREAGVYLAGARAA